MKKEKVEKKLNETIEIFVEYAMKQGSEHSEKYFIHYFKLINKTMNIKSREREALDEETKRKIKFLENILSSKIMEEIYNGTKYKEIYVKCKNICEEYKMLIKI